LSADSLNCCRVARDLCSHYSIPSSWQPIDDVTMSRPMGAADGCANGI